MRVDAVMTAWLGETLPSPAVVIAAARWEADDPRTYCWRCGETTGAGEVDVAGCGGCRAGIGAGPSRRIQAPCDRLVRLSAYADPMRTWIRRVKYGARWFEMGHALGWRLGVAVADLGLDPARTIVVPMPMPWTRRLQRGIDHARVIADGVGESGGWPVVPLLRRLPSEPQAARTRNMRHRGGQGMRMRTGARIQGLDVVLVDDVRTTGATLAAATRLMRTEGCARVIGAVLAVVDPPARRAPDRLDVVSPD